MTVRVRAFCRLHATEVQHVAHNYDETDGGAPGDNALGDNMQLICLVDSAIGLAASLRLAHGMRLQLVGSV